MELAASFDLGVASGRTPSVSRQPAGSPAAASAVRIFGGSHIRESEGSSAAWDSPHDDEERGGAGSKKVDAGALIVGLPHAMEITRGPYGGRPLYYTTTESHVLVSSRLATIAGAIGKSRGLDLERLGALGISRVGPDARATVYKGVYRVLPCETLRFGADGSTTSSFRLPRPPEQLRGNARENAAALREALSAEVKRQLRGVSAVAVLTGGGLDSAGILGLVAKQAAEDIGLRFVAVAMDFAGPGDDRPHLAALLHYLKADALRVSPTEVGPLYPQFFEQDAAPYTFPTCPVGEVVARRAKAWGAEGLMTGFAGDYVLDGDLTSFASRLKRGHLGVLREVGKLQVPWMSTPFSRVADLLAKPLLRSALPPEWLAKRRERLTSASDVWAWAGPRLRPVILDAPRAVAAGEHWLTRSATSHEFMEAADGIAQTESAWGLRHMNPYLGPRIIEFVASIPPHQIFAGGRVRGLFRDSMVDILPDSVRLRSDKARFEPMFERMVSAAGGVASFEPLLTMEATADLGLVLPREFAQAFRRVVAGATGGRGWLQVWPMLAVEAFVRGLQGPACLRLGAA